MCSLRVYRVPLQESNFSLDELSDCSSGSIEVCCDDLTPGWTHTHTQISYQKQHTSFPLSLAV